MQLIEICGNAWVPTLYLVWEPTCFSPRVDSIGANTSLEGDGANDGSLARPVLPFIRPKAYEHEAPPYSKPRDGEKRAPGMKRSLAQSPCGAVAHPLSPLGPETGQRFATWDLGVNSRLWVLSRGVLVAIGISTWA